MAPLDMISDEGRPALPITGLAPDELIGDLFAGGGGASEAIYRATGRHPDFAINHDEDAVQVHTINHPACEHFCQSIWEVRPEDVQPGRRIGMLWLSPDCRHHSRASGGRPKWKSVRSLPGVTLTWAKRRRPRIIILENVAEIEDWGPLLDDGTPCPKRRGLSWKIMVGRLRGLGYNVEWRNLNAADFGAPTTRTRLFMVARRDGQGIRWPEPTHARRPSMFEARWRSAAECIDWSRDCPSIFERSRPLAEATLRRIAHGLTKFVLNSPDPFIITIDHQTNPNGVRGTADPLSTTTAKARHAVVTPFVGVLRNNATAHGADEPLRTVSAQGGHHMLVAPTLIQTGYGEREGQAPRVPGIGKPLGTAVAGGQKHALVTAFLAQHNGGAVGCSARRPVSTLTTKACQQQLVTASLSADDEAGARRVAAFLVRYNGTNIGQDLRDPLGTTTTKERFALVEVAGHRLPIVDIGMRMLHWTELAKAQAFPPEYVLDRGADGRQLTKTTIVRLIGNSVSPPPAVALLRANLGLRVAEAMAA